jgi:hypothetical protein
MTILQISGYLSGWRPPGATAAVPGSTRLAPLYMRRVTGISVPALEPNIPRLAIS